MKNKIILHVPHSSTSIPMMEGYLLDETALENEILKVTDWYTDDLFESKEDISITADFSRIFCDPERFTDDAQEVMAQFGMGVLYEKNDAGEKLREVTPALKEKVLNEYYWVHHKKFSTAVSDQLEAFGTALIVDCHSYPSTPLLRDLDKNPNRPDFNIGTDAFHTPHHLIDLSIDFFKKKGYSLGVDWPYKGSIVPLEYYGKEKKVQSVMLEINRGLYLNEPTNEKSERYDEVKTVVGEFLRELKRSLG